MTWRPVHDAPFWCEENAWHLCVEPAVGPDARVVVISNPHRTVALWHQRAQDLEVMPVVWDYHVIVVGKDGAVWDLDTRLGFPISTPAYLAGTFRAGVPEALRPSLRIITAHDYRTQFASDRRHMRADDGDWQQPPPPWPTIGTGHTLDALLDLDDPRFGPWVDLQALYAGRP